MKTLLLCLLSAAATNASWLGEEYWTKIDSTGHPYGGGSLNDFARLDGDENKFVAFWITRSHYPGEHFEAFGMAHQNADGRICATFAGFRRENIEICGEFRVLSIPARLHGHKVFQWASAHISEDSVGYLAHRIAKITTADGELLYGDSIPSRRTFAGALRTRTDTEIIQTTDDFVNRVQLLKLEVLENLERPPVLPRIPRPVPVQPVYESTVICDQYGNAFEKKVDPNGRPYYVEYDERTNGGRRAHCQYVAPVVQAPVAPVREDRYTHAILPDHHDANGTPIGDENIGYRGRRYRRKILRDARKAQEKD